MRELLTTNPIFFPSSLPDQLSRFDKWCHQHRVPHALQGTRVHTENAMNYMYMYVHVVELEVLYYTYRRFLQDLIKLYAVYNDALINILGKLNTCTRHTHWKPSY